MEVDSSSRIFMGVHFVLYGFNSIDENEVRFKLVSGGGVDAGQYSQSCTHVIVDKLVYDDDVCVAARNDGKMLVTVLWVNHSYDLGAVVNAYSIMYRPVVDLNGIPGAERLTICLTGYQRQDRDDVMTMVSLMGAKFSKPLIAHKVTHLICYKFEGEKYELARRLKTIKLVNHRWLEDCLRHWGLLPEANYNTSGYDLENIELEAKDSEEESDNIAAKHIGVRSVNSSITLQPSSTLDRHLSTSVSGTSSILPVLNISDDPENIDVAKHAELVPAGDNKCILPRNSSDIDISSSELVDIHLRTPVSKKISDQIASPSISDNAEDQSGSRSYSRRNPRKSALLHSVGRLNNLLDSPVPFSGSKVSPSFEPPFFVEEPEQKSNGFGPVHTPEKGAAAVSEEILINGLPQKRTSIPLKSLSNPLNAEMVRLKITPSLENESPSKLKSCDPSLPQNSPHRSLVTKSICLPESPFTIDLLSSIVSADLGGNADKISQQSPGQVVSEYEGELNQHKNVKETSRGDKSVEAYEWYKKGLSEDGAINLEAPRKWRHLRERTGHGAFYGMKIIVYGECIAPPLDTLKRAVKAGDGTILATSPPYSRFLTSEVDFAIVSPSMPRVDIWVQEFLKHEIPCVVADYLVEYVCKPGYPLDKHVLYNTQAWAEKSFNKLQRKAEEIATVSLFDSTFNENDIACQVCGSRERGDVMLICGDENGSVGCGIGMHIDCCNPVLHDVPEDDWFCSECVSNKKLIHSSKKRRQD